jgi:hypothetical protein
MNEAEIRMQCQMYALVATMNAKIARIEGMKTENEYRRRRGVSDAYSEDAFVFVQNELEAISKSLEAL